MSLVTFWTLVDVLKSNTSTPFIFIGVLVVRPCGVAVVTVTIVPGVDPSPEIILEILIGSDAKAPTISNSGLWGANPSEFAGNLSTSLMVLDVALKAFDNLL